MSGCNKKGLMERLSEGPVIGDGGFLFCLERRGYVKAGPWTPEAVCEHPEAVLQLHKEFLRAGSDVMQAFTFYASDDKLVNRGNKCGKEFTGDQINDAACQLAKEAATGEGCPEGGALTLGGLCQSPTYLSGATKDDVKNIFRKQVEVFVRNGLDFVLCEYFEHIEEMEWAIEVCKEDGKGMPIAASMCIGVDGDLHGVTAGECAVRMAKAGANVVGVNCHFDPFLSLDALKLMKTALSEANLLNKPTHLMCQPLAISTPDAGKQGFIDLPEFPFALEPRTSTRWEIHRYARQAHELGVRFIGGCCGFEPYHIRAVSEELKEERNGRLGLASDKHVEWGGGLRMHTKPWVRARSNKEYWRNLEPSSGRPFSSAMSRPDAWGVTQGHQILKQKEDETTDADIKEVTEFKAKVSGGTSC